LWPENWKQLTGSKKPPHPTINESVKDAIEVAYGGDTSLIKAIKIK
jgi:hypothetical protein